MPDFCGYLTMDSGGKNIILFDGVCNLCNGFVQFVIKYDKDSIFQFVSLQSDFARQLFKEHNVSSDIDSVALLTSEGSLLFKSSAALKILGSLSLPWSLSRVFYIFPRFFRDMIYNFIARNRYKWFGKQDNCMLPTPELRSRFLQI